MKYLQVEVGNKESSNYSPCPHMGMGEAVKEKVTLRIIRGQYFEKFYQTSRKSIRK